MNKFADNPDTCSVPSPFQSSRRTTLYYKDLVTRLPAVSSIVQCNSNAERGLNDGYRAVIQLVLLNHTRCSEVLDIKFCDMIKPFMFLVHGKKKSYNYMLHIPFGPRNLKFVQENPYGIPLFPFTYNAIWRAMCNAGMSIAVAHRVKNIVTHRARYELSSKLELLNERASITPLLHHKSAKSKNYYQGVLPI